MPAKNASAQKKPGAANRSGKKKEQPAQRNAQATNASSKKGQAKQPTQPLNKASTSKSARRGSRQRRASSDSLASHESLASSESLASQASASTSMELEVLSEATGTDLQQQNEHHVLEASRGSNSNAMAAAVKSIQGSDGNEQKVVQLDIVEVKDAQGQLHAHSAQKQETTGPLKGRSIEQVRGSAGAVQPVEECRLQSRRCRTRQCCARRKYDTVTRWQLPPSMGACFPFALDWLGRPETCPEPTLGFPE